MRYKQWIVIVIISILIFGSISRPLNPLQAEETDNPLKIEKIIGLSTEPGTFRMSRPGEQQYFLPEQQGLAISSDGSIYIGDNAEGQIEIFSSNLEPKSNFGSLGSGDGQFQYLTAMAFDKDDNLYTVDHFLKVIQVFSKEGKYLRRFGEFGDKKEQLVAPNDIFFINSDELIVVDFQLGLKVYSRDGKYLRDFCQNEKIQSIDYKKIRATVDQYGFVYVITTPTNYMNIDLYLLKFKPDGTFIGNVLNLGYDSGDWLSEYDDNYNIATNENYIYLSDRTRIQKYEIQKSPERPIKLVETFLKIIDKEIFEEFHNLGKSDFCYPSAILWQNKKFFVLDGLMNRLLLFSEKKEFLGSIQSSIKEISSLYNGDKEVPKGYFSNPRGIRIDQLGNLIIANFDFGRVSILNQEGEEIRTMGSRPDPKKDDIEPGDLFNPKNIVIDQQGYFFVQDDYYEDLMQVFRPDYQPFFKMPDFEDFVLAFAVNTMNHLVISEGDPNFIRFYDISQVQQKKIKFIKKFSMGYEYATDIVIDSEDNMIVATHQRNNLLWLDTSGNIVRRIASKDEENPIFKGPISICIDGNNDVYITEFSFGRIHKYSTKGKLLWKTDLNWLGLSALAIDTQGKLFATDSIHNIVLEISDKTVTPVKITKPGPIQSEAVFSLQVKNKEPIFEEDVLTIGLSGKNIKMLASMNASLLFPSNLLTFKSVNVSDDLKDSGFWISSFDCKDNQITFNASSINKKEYYESGDMILFEFIAKKAGDVTISIETMELKNSLDRVILYKEKNGLNCIIQKKDRTAPTIKVHKIPAIVYQPTITIRGETEPDATVTINTIKVPVQADGFFMAILDLKKGKNEIHIVATDKAHNQAEFNGSVNWEDPIQIKMKIGSKIIWVQGNAKLMDAEPYIDKVSERTMVPLLAIAQGIKAKIEYESSTRKITIQFEDTNIILWIGKSTALVNGKEVKIDEQYLLIPVIVNSRTFLPLRFIAKNLNFRIEWDTSTQTITLNYPKD